MQNEKGEKLSGKTVHFEVVSGPNAGLKGKGTTNASGQTKFSYSSKVTGTDHVVATFTNAESEVETSNEVTVKWTSLSGVMSGEGRLTDEGKVADFAFILGCHPTNPKPRLEVLLGGKAYVLSSESSNLCTNQPSPEPPPEAGAKFNTMEGSGPATGGTVITWKFLDGGVGGTNDLSSIKLTKGATVLFKAGPATPGSFGGGTRQGRNTALPPGEY